MNEITTFRLDIAISQAQIRDELLTDAVNRLIPAALERRYGILVTQHDASNYSLEIDPSVPCGTIHEKSHPGL